MKINFSKTSKDGFMNAGILRTIFSIKKYYYRKKVDILAVFIFIFIVFNIWTANISYKFFVQLFILIIFHKFIQLLLKYKIVKKQLHYISEKFNVQILSSEYDFSLLTQTIKNDPTMWVEVQKELLLIEKEVNFLTFYGPMKTREVKINTATNNQKEQLKPKHSINMLSSNNGLKIKKMFNRFK